MNWVLKILIGLILFIIFVWLLIYFSIFLLIVFWIFFIIFFIRKIFQDWLKYFKKWQNNNFETDFHKVKKHFVSKWKNKFWDDIEIEDAEVEIKK